METSLTLKMSPARVKKSGRSGFTLVEILVAATLFAVFLAGFSNVFLTVNKWLQPSGSSRNVAYTIAEAELEDLYEEVGTDYWSSAVTTDPLSVPLYSGADSCSGHVGIAGTPKPCAPPRNHNMNHGFNTSSTSETAAGANPVLDTKTYTVSYDATAMDADGDGVEDYRKVDAIVDWTP